MSFFQSRLRGFTLMEMVVIICIIGILVSIVAVHMVSSKKRAYDIERTHDIDELFLAMRLYVDLNGKEIDCITGMKIDGQSVFDFSSDALPGVPGGSCTDGATIIDFIKSYFGEVPHDPRGPGNKDYYYYFDPDHECSFGGANRWPLLWATNSETMAIDPSDQCFGFPAVTPALDNDGGLLNTTQFGGTKNPSVPYMKRLDFVEGS